MMPDLPAEAPASRSANADAPDSAGPPPPWAQRHFALILSGICLCSLLCRAVILSDYLTNNPAAGTPIVDAKTYWDWAARIAAGHFIQDEPFFSAPLYPYLLGLLRAVGANLGIVYGLQLLLDVATACVLAYAARLRFSANVGLLAAGLFLLLQEPASFALRILTCSLQLLLLAITYLQLIKAQSNPSVRRVVLLGVALGLLCLSYPPAMVLVVAVVPWLFWQSRRRLADALRAALPLVVAALLIAPATLHNWYVSGDLFFIQSVTAVNLRQGNQPGSDGGYTPIPNTATDRTHLFQDVAKLYTQETGKPADWADIDHYYRRQVFDFWRSDPARTLKLAARKLYYFLSSRNYADIYGANAEIDYGLNSWLRLAPLAVPWLMGPALLGLLFLLRRPIRYLPEWLMFAVPLALVVVHWYTPRYRLPAIPVLVVVAAWTLERAGHWRVLPRRAKMIFALPTVALLMAGIGLGFVNRAAGFDLLDPTHALFTAAAGFQQQGQTDRAVALWRQGLALKPHDAASRVTLGDFLNNLGKPDEALVEFRAAWAITPDDPTLPGRIAQILFRQRKLEQAEQILSQAVQQHATNGTLLGMLADLKDAQGYASQAAEMLTRAVQLSPDDANLHTTFAGLLLRLGEVERARAELDRAAQLAGDDSEAHRRVGVLEVKLGNLPGARMQLERAVALQPRSAQALHDLGVLNLKEGRLDEASACFRQALTLNPTLDVTRRALQQVEQLKSGQPGAGPQSP